MLAVYFSRMILTVHDVVNYPVLSFAKGGDFPAGELKKHMHIIEAYASILIVMSFFGIAKIALSLPESFVFMAILIPIIIFYLSIHVINVVQKNYMKLLDYELILSLYEDKISKSEG